MELTLGDVLRRCGEGYRHRHRLPGHHVAVMRAIERCRTPALGGHVEHCRTCGYEGFAYNSCRNRHCPTCQGFARETWLADRLADLLPVPYFHVVFTLPHELNPLALHNRRRLLGLLFTTASASLLELAHNRLGGRLGAVQVLHTWDQTLGLHLHLHCVIPAGVLHDHPEASRFRPLKPSFLLPVKALAMLFRGKLLDALVHAHAAGRLRLPPGTPEQDADVAFRTVISTLYRKPWVVYAKKPFAGPEMVFRYLARYTHRVAISNRRLLALDHEQVTFSYRDRRQGNQTKQLTLHPDELIRRFLLHVLPPRFVRIRHVGFLANRAKALALARCRASLRCAPRTPAPSLSTIDRITQLIGRDPTRCPHCGALLLRTPLPALRAPPTPMSTPHDGVPHAL